MLSFWEKNTFTTYDYIIVGSGITGLSAACEIKENWPDKSVLILEKGLLPSGASTKNAGFACIGSLSENCADIELMGEDAFLHLTLNRWQGLQILRNRLGDDAIAYESNGGYELVLEGKDDAFINRLDYMNQLLFTHFNKSLFTLQPQAAKQFGLNQNLVKTVIKNEVEGQLDTGKMMQALIRYTQKLGVSIITGAHVLNVQENPENVLVQTETIDFRGKHLFICTNAFTKELLPGIELEAGRGQVIVTAPIPNLKVKGIFFFDEGYYYFRNYQNRIVFGGGRNLDFAGENTIEFGSNQKILDVLQYYLKELILPETTFEMEHNWSGIMAFGSDKTPIVKRISERQSMAVRLNGMGVALGSKLARDLVEISRS